MNKKLLYGGLVVVGVIIIVFLVINGGKSDTTIEESVKSQSTVQDTEKTALVAGNYELDTKTAVVQWEGKKTLIEGYVDRGTLAVKQSSIVTADSGLVSGSIVFDMSSIQVVTTGIGKGQDGLKKHLASSDFFDVAKHPTATFVVVKSEKTEGENMYNVTGDLTMKGKTNSVTLPMQVYMSDAGLRLVATAKLDRTKWGIVYGSGSFFDNLANNVIDDMFVISFDLVAKVK